MSAPPDGRFPGPRRGHAGGGRGCRHSRRPDRSKPPAPGPTPALTLPATQKFTLANGLRVWLLEQHEVPLVQANLVVLSGASADVPGQFGAASMTAAMLDEGAAGKAALALADEVEFLGAQLSTVGVVRCLDGAAVDAGGEARRGAAPDGRGGPHARLPRRGARAPAHRAPDRAAPGARRSGIARRPGVSAPALRTRAPLRHERRRHRDVAQGARRGRAEDVPPQPLPARQRRAHRGGRHDARPRCGRWSRRASARWTADGAAGRAVPGAGVAAAGQAPDLSRRQARRRAVADPHRAGRRAALDVRLHRARRAQHHPRRLVHLAPEHQPAREARLLLRRHARASTCGAPPGRSSRPPACRPTRPPRR